MSGPNRGAPNCRIMFVDPETAFGTAATQYPVAADALRIISGSVTVKNPTQAREDAFCTGTKNGSISLKQTVEWSAEFYLYTPGTAATSPDWHDLFVNCLPLQQTAAVADTAVTGATSTVSIVAVTDASNFVAGTSAVTINGETRRITALDSVSSPNTITFTVPLSAIPTAADTVTSALLYYPNDANDVLPAGATIWLGNNAHLWRLTGAVATSLAINGGGDGAIRGTVSGRAREGRLLFTSTIPAGVNNSDLTFTVGSGDMIPDDVSVANPYYITASKGLAVEEFIRVTGKAGAVLTVVRGQPSGSGQIHAANATVEPYVPAGTYLGSPIPATGGHAYMAGTLTQIETFGVDLDPGMLSREDQHGAAFKFADYALGMRSVTNRLETWSINSPQMLRVRDALQRVGIEVFEQQGDTTGSIVALDCPLTYCENPDFAFDDGEVRLSFSGEARGTTEDELFILVG